MWYSHFEGILSQPKIWTTGFLRRRQKVPDDGIANALFKMMVLEGDEDAHPERYPVPANIWPQFASKMRLYREATMLMALLAQNQKEKRYEKVLTSFEQLIFPTSPDDGVSTKAAALKNATRDLGDLFSHDRADEMGLLWSRKWFAQIGYEENNPIRLSVFAISWMDRYIAAIDTLEKLLPI
jgi:hypothetical protein